MKLFSTIKSDREKIPFTPPLFDFDEKSDIVYSACDCFPLALYDTHLQGRWKRLYTTQKDGFSFNRIAHHVSVWKDFISLNYCACTRERLYVHICVQGKDNL